MTEKPRDRLYGTIFDVTQQLRKDGHTPAELAARYREMADDLEEHFGDKDSWHEAPVDKSVTLPGPSEE